LKAEKPPQNHSPSAGARFQSYSPIATSEPASSSTRAAQAPITTGMNRRLGIRFASHQNGSTATIVATSVHV
jgi:hypothetical protein